MSIEDYKKEFELKFAQALDNDIWKSITSIKPRKLTPEEKKANKLAVLKEKKRRDKKITMTVGELEDKLEAERYSDY